MNGEKLPSQAFGWSKCVFSLLGCKPPSLTKRKDTITPIIIRTESENNKFSIEIKVAKFAMKIVIRERRGFNDFGPQIETKKMIKHHHSFEKFAEGIIRTYGEAVGFISNVRIRSIMSEKCIIKLEQNGLVVGIT